MRSEPVTAAAHSRFELDAEIVRRTRIPFVVAALLFLGGTRLLAGGSPELGVSIQLGAALIAGFAWASRPRAVRRTRITVTEAGLTLDGEVVCRAADVVGTSVLSHRNGRLLSLTLRSGARVDLVVPTDLHVAELRAALGLTSARAAARTYEAHAALGALSLVLTLVTVPVLLWFCAAIVLGMHRLWSSLIPILFVGPPLLLVRAKRVVVTCGEEGVHLRSLFRSRLVRHEDIVSAKLIHGSVVELVIVGAKIALELPTGEGAALIEDIGQRRSTAKADRPPSVETLLARSGRDATAWLETVRAQVSVGASTYRGLRASEDQLWSVVEDPAADPTSRVAAAVLLREGAVEAGQRGEVTQRIRVSAKTTALPQVRVALEEAADAADAEVVARVARVMRS